MFKGLMDGAIPIGGGGLIFNVAFSPKFNYGVMEVVGFKNVKNVIQGSDGVTFQSDGYKIFVVYEPKTYTQRYMEPYLRTGIEQIPLRFNELKIIDLPSNDRVFVSAQPYVSHGSFTIEAPEEGDFVYYLFENDKLDKNAEEFLAKILKDDFQVRASSLQEILPVFSENLKSFHTLATPV